MSDAFTPGPWVAQSHGHVSCIGRDGVSGYRVANAFGLTLTSFQEQEANARLIAAAPELLEALEDLVIDCEMGWRDPHTLADAKAVLAKARGDA